MTFEGFSLKTIRQQLYHSPNSSKATWNLKFFQRGFLIWIRCALLQLSLIYSASQLISSVDWFFFFLNCNLDLQEKTILLAQIAFHLISLSEELHLGNGTIHFNYCIGIGDWKWDLLKDDKYRQIIQKMFLSKEHQINCRGKKMKNNCGWQILLWKKAN